MLSNETELTEKRWEIAKLWSFAIHPRDYFETLNLSQKFRRLLSLLLIAFAINFLATGLYELMHWLTGFKIEEDVIESILKQKELRILVFILAAFILPIAEEFIFRFFLKYDRFFPIALINSSKANKNVATYEELNQKSFNTWSRFFPYLVYSSTIIFALLHIGNFKLGRAFQLQDIILVVPHFLLGLLFVYTRVRYGIVWSILTHVIYNSTLLIYAVFTINAEQIKIANEPERIDTLKTDDYTLIVKDYPYEYSESINTEATYSVNYDTITMKNCNAKGIGENIHNSKVVMKNGPVEINIKEVSQFTRFKGVERRYEIHFYSKDTTNSFANLDSLSAAFYKLKGIKIQN